MKKTISLILCFAMLLSTVAFSLPAFAVELDFGVEAAGELAQDEVVLLGTAGNNDGKPGYNVVTGTKEPYGFDAEGFWHYEAPDRENEIIADPANASNKVLWIGDAKWSNAGITPIPNGVTDIFYPLAYGKSFEAERPFTMTFDLKGTATAHPLCLMSGLDNASPGWKTMAKFNVTNNWVQQTHKFTYAQASESLGKFVMCFYNGGAPIGDYYIDNLSIVPDYRIAFYAADGRTVIKSEYVSSTATTYKVSSAAFDAFAGDPKFIGFKLAGTEDTDLVAAGTVINLANEDVSFVAVTEANVTAPSFIVAEEGTTAVITAKYEADWSVDDNGVLVDLEANGTSATITTKGYAGVIKVTATSVENPETSETVTINLRGPSKARPGVNVLTGTNSGLGFEESAEEISKSVSFPQEKYGQTIVSVVENPRKSVNTSDYALKLFHDGKTTGQRYPQVSVESLAKGFIEKERPVEVSFDVYGLVNAIWFFDNAAGTVTLTPSNNINGDTAKAGWTSTKFTLGGSVNKDYFVFQSYRNNGETTSLYMDNLSIVPYYKVVFYEPDEKTVIKSEYLKGDTATYTIPSEVYTGYADDPKFRGFKYVGTDDEDIVEGTITLANQDLIFVAVKDIEVSAPSFVEAVEGTKAVLTAKYEADWSIDDGGKLVTFEASGDTATITTKGYAGTVNVTAVSVENPERSETVTINLRGPSKARPGVNMLTGTTAGFDFEGTSEEIAKTVSFTREKEGQTVVKVSNNPNKSGNASDNALELFHDGNTTGQRYPIIEVENLKTYGLVENERPVDIYFDAYGTEINFIWLIKDASGTAAATLSSYMDKNAAKTGWVPMNYTWNGTQEKVQFVIQTNINKGGAPLYIDNLSLIPYYRVSFYEPDGRTVIKTEYIKGNATSYTVPTDVYAKYEGDRKFLGYKLMGADDEGFIEQGATFTLENEDLSFIAVKDVDILAPSFIEAVEGTEAVITAKYAANWSVDDESLVTIEGDGDTATITTKGYAGTINVTAVSVDDPEMNETVAINLRGPSKAKPGVNILTGTAAGLDFEGGVEEVTKSITFSREVNEGTKLVRVSENPIKSGNTSGYALELYHDGNASGQRYPQIEIESLKKYGLIENERPVEVSFDVHGTVYFIWFFDDTSGEIDAYFSNNVDKNAALNGWTSMKYTLDETHNKDYFLIQTNINKGDYSLYLDNFSIVPYYKVTYLDETGKVAKTEYVAPSNGTYTVSAEMISQLDSEKYEGYKLVGTADTVNEVVLGTEDIFLVPSAKEGVEAAELVTLKFASQNVKNVPGNSYVVSGTEINMSDYYGDTASSVAGKRFVGWSAAPDGSELDIIHDTFVVNEDTTFYPVLSYDINFATADGQNGWTFNAGTITFEDGFMKTRRTAGSTVDQFIQRSGVDVPAYDIYKLVFWVAEEYTRYSDENHTQVFANKKFTTDDSFEGLYYTQPGAGISESRKVYGYVRQIVEGPDGKKYAGIEVDFGTHSGVNQAINLSAIRFDTIALDIDFRYIQFVDYEEYSEAERSVEITGISEPETAKTVDFTSGSDAAGLAEIVSIDWVCEDGFMEYTYNGVDYKRFDGEKEYTVSIVTKPADAEKIFADDTTVTVNGKEAEAVVKNGGKSLEISYTFNATDPLKEFGLSISGPDTISKAGRTTQYKTTVDNADVPVRTATWSLEAATKEEYEAVFGEGSYEDYVFESNCATIFEDSGKLTPVLDGVIVLVATSHYNPEVQARFLVTLEKQDDRITVIYDKNTSAEVTGMPESIESAGRITLSTEEPAREGYVFVGWSASEESRETVDAVIADGEDITVYAVWDKIQYSFEFNNSLDGFETISNGTTTKHDTYLEVKTTSGDDVRLTHNGGLNINSKRINRVIIKQSSTKDSYATMFYWIPGQTDIIGNGSGEEFSPVTSGANQSTAKSLTYTGLDDWKVFELTFETDPDWSAAKYIHKLAYDPFQATNTIAYIDYIRFIDDYRDITFDANAGEDTVTGMPEDLYTAVGEYYTVKAIPVREGYTFLGWSKTASGEYANTFYIGDDITLYAVWAKAVEIDEDGMTAELSVDGALEEDFVVVTTNPGARVTVIVETSEGEQEPVIVTADENGVAKVELLGGEDIQFITVESSEEMEEVVLAGEATADAIVEAVAKEKEAAAVEDDSDSDEEGSDSKYDYNTTVEDVKPTTDAYKTEEVFGGVGESEIAVTSKGLKDLMASEGEILINFDKDFEKEFFPASSLRQFASKGMSDSVIVFENKGFANGSKDNPALFTANFELDAAAHPYIVMKIKNSADSTCKIYFKTDESSAFSESKSMTKDIKSEYSMVVYDMSTLENWNGTVTGLFLAMGATEGHLIEIDWIMFTDTIPENMDVIEGTRELFPTVNKNSMAFSDVTADDWFYSEVATAYRLGFVQGMTETEYDPRGNVTLAQAITLAVRLNYSYNGLELPEVAEGAEWYSEYVKAAVKAGIIKNNQFEDYTKTALRKEVAQIIQKALPADYLPAINVFKVVPDVSVKDPAYGAIRKLYNAGIVVGMDEECNFYPETNVTRAEIAAIVNRMAVPVNRKRVVTEAELEQRRVYYYAEELAAATLGNCYNSKPTVSKDLVTATGKTADPIVYLTPVVGELNGKELTKITVGLKTEGLAKPVIFFTTPAGGWAATRLISGKAGETDENGVTAYTFDVKSNSQFADTITGLRFDPFDAKDIEFSIAYVIIE